MPWKKFRAFGAIFSTWNVFAVAVLLPCSFNTVRVTQLSYFHDLDSFLQGVDRCSEIRIHYTHASIALRQPLMLGLFLEKSAPQARKNEPLHPLNAGFSKEIEQIILTLSCPPLMAPHPFLPLRLLHPTTPSYTPRTPAPKPIFHFWKIFIFGK